MPAYLADTPSAYRSLGLEKGVVKPSEDGLRTDPGGTTFEWWYFDTHLEDGTALVITFYTKPMLAPALPLTPMIRIDLERPDGTTIERRLTFSPDQFSASGDGCDVRIAANTFSGDLATYTIHVEDEGFTADVTLERTVPSWRPETGHMYFNDGRDTGEKLLGWVAPVPVGTVEATLTLDGVEETLRGIGYHDHNWGDAPLNQLIHNWRWGRAQVGPYSLVWCYITAEEQYGDDTIPLFLITKDGRIVADDAKSVTLSTGDRLTDDHTGKPVDKREVYEYSGPEGHYRLTLGLEQVLVRNNFIDDLEGPQREAAQAAGFDASYLRFTGSATVEQLVGEVITETHTASAIWELMYFGHAR
ncbi:hydroxyneurosporene dehydrogenase [Streptomyces fuscichromogenes]|uniref:Hydroxyneurosporene synthase n=1 Tax=Streptomyces fuscichromogenes TaxID=1324013 RepID=A0A917XG23_9ACTN|nr:hydroxyneurosporene dehydrogenase [Streptomyces fuscichromogenes]GGN19350.1 hypothetical protein GCM10011578_049220 [Streptomyces fuscichromogenes]